VAVAVTVVLSTAKVGQDAYEYLLETDAAASSRSQPQR